MPREALPLNVRTVTLALACVARHERGLFHVPGDDRVETPLRHRVVLCAYAPMVVLALHKLLVRVILIAFSPEQVGAHVRVVDAHRVLADDDEPAEELGLRYVDVLAGLAGGLTSTCELKEHILFAVTSLDLHPQADLAPRDCMATLGRAAESCFAYDLHIQSKPETPPPRYYGVEKMT